MSIKNLDRYFDPPDEPEIPICESCGKDMELDFWGGGTKCLNPLCPDKFTGAARALAEKIVELEEENSTLKSKCRFLKNRLDYAEHLLDKAVRTSA